MFVAGHSKKDLNFEINLIPIIDIMSCCVCFLLITAAWIQIGALDLRQGRGSSSSESPLVPRVSAQMKGDGSLVLSIENSKNNEVKTFEKNSWANIEKYLQSLSGLKQAPRVALLAASPQTDYQDLVHLMDLMKAHKFSEVGITPY